MDTWILPLCLMLPIAALSVTPAEASDFPDDDLEERIGRVNDGQLAFLHEPPDHPVHHHHNILRIHADSLRNGWVELSQCHYDLDPVDATQIVYHPDRVRQLRITFSRGIEQHRVEGASVQLSGIGQGASLCVRAESRAFSPIGDGGYRLRNGPYMRRFLDGYYPMWVSLEIHYPAERLVLQDFRPDPGAAGGVLLEPGEIRWNGWFAGQLFTEFDFQVRRGP